MKVIAHGISDPKIAKYAISKGVDFLEIDVSKRFFFNKFTAQHNGLFGLAGLGPILETLLTTEIRTRAFLDLKPISYRASFAARLAELLLRLGVKDARICGHNWKMLSLLSTKVNAKPYYTIRNQAGADRFRQMLPELKQPVGFSVHHKLIDEKFIKDFKRKSVEIWAWTVNDMAETKRLMKMEIDGIITDNWETLLRYK